MLSYESSSLLSAVSFVRHGFFLRPSLGNSPIDRSMALASLHIDSKLFTVRQVHGNQVIAVNMQSEPDRISSVEADALITADYRLALAISYADCVPILLRASDDSVIAAIHAGWRGLLNGVICNTLTKIKQEFGPKNLSAAIGPAISVDSFCLAGDGLLGFLKSWPQHVKYLAADSYVDLSAVAYSQLSAGGVMQIEKVGGYTDKDSHKYFSHRRDQGQTGRQIAIISLNR